VTFLFPLAAWLGLLALPVIAFYLLKTRQRRRRVSTLLFWNELQPKVENSPLWRKLRRWFSLLLQLLILALLVLALSQPAFEWEQSSPRRVVVVLDNSASMGAKTRDSTRWESAKSEVLAAIDRLRLTDEMAILTMDNPPLILSGWSSSRRNLREALLEAMLRPTATDPAPALALAGELAALRQNGEVLIFSDTVWPEGAGEQVAEEMTVLGAVPEPPPNAGISFFSVRRSPVSPGDWQLEVEVVSSTEYEGVLEIRRNDEPMDRMEIRLGPGEVRRRSWQGSAEAGVEFTAILQTAPQDSLAADNSATCELPPLAPLNILLVGREDLFLEAVLNSIPLVTWWREPRVPQTIPEATHLMIFRGAVPPEELPSKPVLLIDPAVSGFWGERGERFQNAAVTKADGESLLLRHAGFGTIAIGEASNWTPPPGAQIFASSFEQPLLFGRWDRIPEWLVLGFDPAQSDLPLRTAFPILIANILQSLRDGDEAGKAAAILPGKTESLLQGEMDASGELAGVVNGGWNFPAWWLVIFAGLVLLLVEWALFHRRITD